MISFINPTNSPTRSGRPSNNIPIEGSNLLAEINADSLYQRIALEHHERPDGSGYPHGRKKMNHFSRIITICDVYEALTATRIYKDSMTPLKAFMLLKEEFIEYPETRPIVSGLVHCLGIYPVGSLVELSNGERAIVKAIHKNNLRRPTVVIVMDRWFHPLNHPVTVNLKRISDQKKAAHGEVYDDSITISRLLPISEHPDLESRITELIERDEITPI
ncbi:MAG: HD-GYP domain-containing protein [bacterium]